MHDVFERRENETSYQSHEADHKGATRDYKDDDVAIGEEGFGLPSFVLKEMIRLLSIVLLVSIGLVSSVFSRFTDDLSFQISIDAKLTFSNCGSASDAIRLTDLQIVPHPILAPGLGSFYLHVNFAQDLVNPIKVSSLLLPVSLPRASRSFRPTFA